MEIPLGKISSILTVLERGVLFSEEPVVEETNRSWEFERCEQPDVDWYLDLYRRIGAPYLWYGRLTQSLEATAQYLAQTTTELFVLRSGGEDIGLADLDFSVSGRCELVYFGVLPEFVGRGCGRFMIDRLIAFVASRGTPVFWLHTNSNDHGRALGFYRSQGFKPVRQELEIADDPRLVGLYPLNTAPHIPIFDGG